jgi:hypothetical protein
MLCRLEQVPWSMLRKSSDRVWSDSPRILGANGRASPWPYRVPGRVVLHATPYTEHRRLRYSSARGFCLWQRSPIAGTLLL